MRPSPVKRSTDLTRFEFYAAPFRIELAGDLRDRLARAWEGRDPVAEQMGRAIDAASDRPKRPRQSRINSGRT